jgi:outer membrane protein OmpA-like peptidoglycan-associated protein
MYYQAKIWTVSLSFLLGIFHAHAVGQPSGDDENQTVEISYKVRSLFGLNSGTSEFSPFVMNNTLYFTSDREQDYMSYGEGNWKKSAYLSIFQATINMVNDSVAIGKAKPLSYKLNGQSHTGPVCLSADGNTMYFTRVAKPEKVKGAKTVAKPKLFASSLVNGKWSNAEMLVFCTEDASYAHPSMSADGKTLYFASDMATGSGGKDIYKVALDGEGWGSPVNLGGAVNTTGNEMFPSHHEGVLYYSSDGLPGEGGLDFFKSSEAKGVWGAPENLGNSINSPQDDFGMIFNKSGDNGYFSSNREQGMGADDIYYFNVIETIIVKTQDLTGQFRYRTLGRDYADGLEVYLVDDEGNIIATTLTDANGDFSFDKLPLDANYTIKLAALGDDVELIIYGKDGEPQGFLLANKNGEFIYKRLPLDDAGTLSLIDETDIDLSMNTGSLNGQFVFEELAGDYPEGMKVYLVDDDGKIIYTTITDRYGNFSFENLPLDNNYTIKTEENIDDYMILIFNRNGDVIAELKGNAQGEFLYRKLSLDSASPIGLIEEGDDTFIGVYQTVYGQFKYTELSTDVARQLTVEVYTDEDILISVGKTSADGQFRLNNLPLDNRFKFKLGEPIPDEDIFLAIYDRKGEVIGFLKKDASGYFFYSELTKDDPGALMQQLIDDVDIVVMMQNKELTAIYFEKNSSYIDEVSAEKLRQIGQIMIDNPALKIEFGSHTDARASDEYNMDLSEKRTKGVIAYLKRKGISVDRIIGKWHGETQLFNDCGNGVDCPEEKHQENRRTEFKIY